MCVQCQPTTAGETTTGPTTPGQKREAPTTSPTNPGFDCFICDFDCFADVLCPDMCVQCQTTKEGETTTGPTTPDQTSEAPTTALTTPGFDCFICDFDCFADVLCPYMCVQCQQTGICIINYPIIQKKLSR